MHLSVLHCLQLIISQESLKLVWHEIRLIITLLLVFFETISKEMCYYVICFSFNKVPNKSIMKALKRICTLNKICSALSAGILEKIVESVHGDIRNAILRLSYECAQGMYCWCQIVEFIIRNTVKGMVKIFKQIQWQDRNHTRILFWIFAAAVVCCKT